MAPKTAILYNKPATAVVSSPSTRAPSNAPKVVPRFRFIRRIARMLPESAWIGMSARIASSWPDANDRYRSSDPWPCQRVANISRQRYLWMSPCEKKPARQPYEAGLEKGSVRTQGLVQYDDKLSQPKAVRRFLFATDSDRQYGQGLGSSSSRFRRCYPQGT